MIMIMDGHRGGIMIYGIWKRERACCLRDEEAGAMHRQGRGIRHVGCIDMDNMEPSKGRAGRALGEDTKTMTTVSGSKSSIE